MADNEENNEEKKDIDMTVLLLAAQRDCYLNVYRAIGELNRCFDEPSPKKKGGPVGKPVDIARAAKCVEVASGSFNLAWSINEQMQRWALHRKRAAEGTETSNNDAKG